MAIATLQSMIAGASIAPGADGSLFRNPLTSRTAEFDELKLVMNGMFKDPTTGDGLMGSTMDIMSTSLTTSAESLSGMISNIGTTIPIMMAAQDTKDQVAKIDSLASGAEPWPEGEAEKAFPGANKCVGFDINAALGPITQLGKEVSNTIKSMVSAVASTIGVVAGTVKEFIAAVAVKLGIVATTAQELLANMQNAVGSSLATIVAAVSGAADSLTSAFGSAITGLQEKAAELFAKAEEAVNGALDYLKGFSVLGLLNSLNPCVKGAMSEVVNPEAVNPTVLAVVASPQIMEVPIDTGIKVAKTTLELPTITDEYKPPPKSVSDKYTAEELASMEAIIDAAVTEQAEAEKAYSLAVADLVRWQQDNDFSRKAKAAGATPEKMEGTNADPAAKAEYAPLYKEWKVKRDAIESTGLKGDILGSRRRVSDMKAELNYRKLYGRTPGLTAKVTCTKYLDPSDSSPTW